jgi:hypothetical protein
LGAIVNGGLPPASGPVWWDRQTLHATQFARKRRGAIVDRTAAPYYPERKYPESMRGIMRKLTRALVVLGSIAIGSLACAAPSAPTGKPNVLVIITDQQNWTMLSCTGNPWLKTPALDSLAATGTRFDRAFCGNPVCVPSRFTMFSGVMPTRIGMDDNQDITNPVSPEIMKHTMGNVFQAAGYETAYGGKVHLPAAGKGAANYGFTTLTLDQRDQLANVCADYLRRKHEKPFLLVA